MANRYDHLEVTSVPNEFICNLCKSKITRKVDKYENEIFIGHKEGCDAPSARIKVNEVFEGEEVIDNRLFSKDIRKSGRGTGGTKKEPIEVFETTNFHTNEKRLIDSAGKYFKLFSKKRRILSNGKNIEDIFPQLYCKNIEDYKFENKICALLCRKVNLTNVVKTNEYFCFEVSFNNNIKALAYFNFANKEDTEKLSELLKDNEYRGLFVVSNNWSKHESNNEKYDFFLITKLANWKCYFPVFEVNG